MTTPPVDTVGAAARSTRRASASVAWKILRRDPVAYAIALGLWVGFYLAPVVGGLALRALLDGLTDGTDTLGWAALSVLAGVEIGRWSVFMVAVVQWHGCWVAWHTVPRLQLLRSLTGDPGPTEGRLPGSPGEAVSRFRDDTEDLALVLDVWLDFAGMVVSVGSALIVMLAIDARVALTIVVPSIAAASFVRLMTPRLRIWRRRQREATAAVTGFIGDTFGAITAIKTAGGTQATVGRFIALGDARARHARRDELGTQLVRTLAETTGNLDIAVTLLVAAPAVSRGDFGIGDLGLFASYATLLAGLPRWIGYLGAYQRQADVSVERLAELLPPGSAPGEVVGTDPLHLRHGPAEPAPIVPGARDRPDALVVLAVKDLTVRRGDTAVIDGIDLEVRRGELVAVTGAVGSGKSTLLRAVLGLVGAEGSVSWNGQHLVDPGAVLVPPRAAYVPQVPRLFSETLADTVLMGVDTAALDEALRIACLDEDLADMAEGTATTVGPKGVRLSGGQIQRAATARALARRPDLLVVDDLSSALDAATEAELWRRFLVATAGETAVLVVTHRPEVLARADQVVRL